MIPGCVPPDLFLKVLNEMHPSIQFTMTKAMKTTFFGEEARATNFLAIVVIKLNDGSIKTDVYYKETNAHDYLHHTSHHMGSLCLSLQHRSLKTCVLCQSVSAGFLSCL